MPNASFLIVKFSDSFEDLWGQLAADLDAEIDLVSEDDSKPVSLDCAAVVLACGGAERQALDWLDRHDPSVSRPTFAVGGDPSRRITAQIIRRGAADYFALPADVELLRNAVGAAVTRRREVLRRDAEASAPTSEAFAEIVGTSPQMRAVLNRASRILKHADATCLIVGETGTGKELLARAMHQGSPRRTAPFVPVNCSALPAHLVESELFGHERGAFTDAHAAKPGLFEVAEGGTLFLDEIGTISVDLQAKLLRALEDHQIRRVGGTKLRPANVRVIAATNDSLGDAITNGTFREDLFFRLSVITLSLPPLREREGDVIAIARALLERLAPRHGIPVPPLTPAARRALQAYHWPGNVRELRNGVERALLLSKPGTLALEELVSPVRHDARNSGPIPFPAHLDEITEAAARATLEMCGDNRSEAARRLGISRRRLRRLLDEDRIAV